MYKFTYSDGEITKKHFNTIETGDAYMCDEKKIYKANVGRLIKTTKGYYMYMFAKSEPEFRAVIKMDLQKRAQIHYRKWRELMEEAETI